MTGRGRGASSRTAQCRGFDTRREPSGVTALFSREEGGERVQTQVDNRPNEHGGSSISGFGCTEHLVHLRNFRYTARDEGSMPT